MLGRVHSQAQVASRLSDCIGQLWEQQHVHTDNIPLELAGLKSLCTSWLPMKQGMLLVPVFCLQVFRPYGSVLCWVPCEKGGGIQPQICYFLGCHTCLGAPAADDPPLKYLPLESQVHLLLRYKFLCLLQGVDLARTLRTISFVGERPFMVLHRKGWTHHRWEEILVLEHCLCSALGISFARMSKELWPRGAVGDPSEVTQHTLQIA